MDIAFVGAGRLAQTLAAAFSNSGVRIVAVASRSTAQADKLAASAPGCVVFESAQEAASAAQLTFITVPDSAIEPVTRQIKWRPGQAVVHCSGATEVAVLQAAADQGAHIGGFHPLQLFADPQVALPLMAGSSVAIEAQGALNVELRRLAAGVGYRPITLPPGVRPRYHAATNYAASFLLSMLREACDLWNSFGVDDEQTLAALLPLARGTLDTAAAKGLPGALAGPISRGDAAVVAMHMRDLAQLDGHFLEFYRSVALRQLRLARERNHLDSEVLMQLEMTLASKPAQGD
jgi:predicted short-subunit dehydrogenase-like oxidoreductase (DUF2520 family)